MFKKILAFAVIAFLSPLLRAQQFNSQDFQKRFEDARYGDLKKIKYFGSIHVHLKNEKSTKIDLNEEELVDYLRLRYKNNFGSVPYRNLGVNMVTLGLKEASTVGRLWCGVWTVGDDFPVAYHVECSFGSMERLQILTDAALGYGNKKNVPETIKKTLDDMLSQFAIQFFKTRGDM